MTSYENVKLTRVGLLVHQGINCCLMCKLFNLIGPCVPKLYRNYLCVASRPKRLLENVLTRLDKGPCKLFSITFCPSVCHKHFAFKSLIPLQNYIKLVCGGPPFKVLLNHVSGVMVSVLTSSAVDCGFEPRSGQNND